MTFEATKSWVINAPAGNNSYVFYHPRAADVGAINLDTYKAEHVEIANQSSTPIYVAMDRPVVAPSGNGVYGAATAGSNPMPTPMAATPGDFDFAVTSNTGWSALDYTISTNSQFMTVMTTGAGLVTVSYGGQV
jgi:hypothetical protein